MMDEERKVLVNSLNSHQSKKMMKMFLARVSKDGDASESLRSIGNEMFKGGFHNAEMHEQIWKFYTMSIAVAKENSEALALAYGNRSAILIHLGKYEACIKDIDRAIEITKNDVFKVKLLCRKIKSLNALGSEENKIVLKEAESLLEKIDDKASKKLLQDLINKVKPTVNRQKKVKNIINDRKSVMLENLYKIHKVNDFSSVDLQYDEKYGRHLVATRDIKPGEVIYVEEPYTKFLNIKKLHAYCSHCFATTWANIACDHCSWTMFCSEECKEDAWKKYHDLECSIYALSKSDGSDVSKQLAVRTLILGIKEAGGIDELKAELKAFDEIDDKTKGFKQDGKLQCIGFKTIYALAKDVSIKNLEVHTDNTIKVLRSIARNTLFFGDNFKHENVQSYKRNENAIFLGSLFLRLSKISGLNHHQMWNGNYVCRNELDRLSCWENECCSRGVYLAPITSLLNHSCDPNARRCYSNDHKVILYAIQPIKKGSQIFDCYQQEFYELDSIPRQQLLSDCYNFDCDCLGCQNKWPHLMEIFQSTRVKHGNKMSSAEIQLSLEYKDLIPSTQNKNTYYDEKTIAFLGKGIEKGLKLLKQPAFTTVNLIICLNTVFERLYGIALEVPDKCNKV